MHKPKSVQDNERHGSCWSLLVQEGDCWCRKVVAGARLVASGQEGDSVGS